MQVDYNHMALFDFELPSFTDNLLMEYNRFEPYLRKAVTIFLGELGLDFALLRYVQIGFYNLPTINKIRDLKTIALGRLMSIHGTITRTTEVKPQLLLASFKCEECNTIQPMIE